MSTISPTQSVAPANADTGSWAARLQPRRSRRRRHHAWLWWAMSAHVGLIAVLWYLIFEVSETHWLGSAVTFLPRLPWLIPGLVLCLISGWRRSRSFWFNAATWLVSLVTVGGFNVPTAAMFGASGVETAADPSDIGTDPAAPRVLRVVSCNVQGFEPDFSLVLREVSRERPDLVVFQEAYKPPKLLAEYFRDWHSVQTDAYWIGSRWPINLVGRCHSDVYDREIGIAAEVDSPFGSFFVVDLHLMTARRSLTLLKSKGVLTGESQDRVTSVLADRQAEANEARVFTARYVRRRPTVICGDFNMPTSSNILRTSFGDLTNVFDATSWGFGHTAPCRKISFWPTNVPWQRIDHVFVNSAWQPTACHIGEFDGSDHRLVSATLYLAHDAMSQLKQTLDPSDAPADLNDEVERLLQ